MSDDDARIDLPKKLHALCEEYALVAMYVFGSRAEEIAARATGAGADVAYPASDVDIGVLPRRDRGLSAAQRVRLMQELEALFAVARVDLVVLPEATAFLAADVVRGELLASTDLDAEAEAQLYYLRRAADLAPLLREQWRETVGSEL
jgi:predicted nucleotidyltransferase